MRDIFKPAITLFSICVFISLCLAFTYSVTKGKIDERSALDAENARKEVLVDADSFKKIGDFKQDNKSLYVKDAYEGLKGSSKVGYVVTVMSKGYGGPVEVVVGIDNNGTTTGVKIGSSNETPGLGSKAKDMPFISQFAKLSLKEPLTVIKGKKSKPVEIEAISGATITSKAVTTAVQTALDTAADLAKKDGAKK